MQISELVESRNIYDYSGVVPLFGIGDEC